MFYNPYPWMNFYGFDAMRPANSYVRVFHASPDAPAVDVYANGSLIAANLRYRGFTEYLTIPPGQYTVQAFAAGTTSNPVINTNVEIPAQSIFTAAAVGRLANIGLQLIPDPLIQRVPGRAYVRFGHLAPGAPNVDVVLQNGTRWFSDVTYTEITGYIAVNPETYTFYLRPAGSSENVLYVPNIRLLPDKIYTIYAVGLVGGNPPLQVLIPLDGSTYIRP